MIWLFIVLFLVGPGALGNWLFLVPAVAFSVAEVASMRLARKPDGPDAEALAPGALKAATVAAPIEVHGKWSSGGSELTGGPGHGILRFAGKRLSFVTDGGETRFDVPVNQVRMAAVPGFWRPQIDLEIGELTHTIRLYPVWDLAATIVGPVVAGEWYTQLRAMGAK